MSHTFIVLGWKLKGWHQHVLLLQPPSRRRREILCSASAPSLCNYVELMGLLLYFPPHGAAACMLLLLLPSLRVKSAAAAAAAHGDSGVLCTISPSVLEDVVAAIIPSGFFPTFWEHPVPKMYVCNEHFCQVTVWRRKNEVIIFRVGKSIM